MRCEGNNKVQGVKVATNAKIATRCKGMNCEGSGKRKGNNKVQSCKTTINTKAHQGTKANQNMKATKETK